MKTIDQMVQQEVIYNVSELVNFILNDEPDKWDKWENMYIEDEDGESVPQDILEYWIVSEWLAGTLIAQGEAVAKDIHGLTIWGRTTSGQHISIDSVIETIYKDMVA